MLTKPLQRLPVTLSIESRPLAMAKTVPAVLCPLVGPLLLGFRKFQHQVHSYFRTLCCSLYSECRALPSLHPQGATGFLSADPPRPSGLSLNPTSSKAFPDPWEADCRCPIQVPVIRLLGLSPSCCGYWLLVAHAHTLHQRIILS